MSKEKNLKPSKELPLGFVDRQEQELLIRDFIISNKKNKIRPMALDIKPITIPTFCLS